MMSELPYDMEVVLPQPRNIAVIAFVVALCCGAIAIPVAALGNADDSTATSTPQVPTQLLEARQDVADVNQHALDTAPPAVGGHCNATLDVPGIGDACRTSDGLLRVEQADGSSSTIHGLDPQPLNALSYAPGAEARVGAAGPADIDCVADSAYHYTLVYAHPANVTSRFGEIAPKLRTEAYKISAYIDSESQSVAPKEGRRLPFSCDGGTPRVLNAQLDATSGGVVFNDVVSNFQALGYAFNSANSPERYLVYVDAVSAAGAGVAGTGHIFSDHGEADEANPNNNGGLYAMQYRYAGNGGPDGSVPRWNVLVHELSHTMGAVANSAPHASGIGHCNDGNDVMCYADGGGTSNYSGSVCSTMVLDCNRDDYFNPAPAAGSYLASHWNMAGAANHWLQRRQTGDQVPPISPSNLVQTGASNNAIGLSWTPASDNVGVTAYDVAIRTPSGTWRTALTTARRTATITPLTASTAWEVSVSARDAAGNVGPAAIIAAATNDQPDSNAPSAPTNVTVRPDLKTKTVTISWSESSDDIGVATYEVHRLDKVGKGTKRAIRGAQRTVETTVTLPTSALKPGTAYLYEVVARDPAGNISKGTRKNVVVPKDRVKPTAPGALTAVTTSSAVKLTWRRSTDNVGITRYRVYQKSGSAWKELQGAKLGPTATSIRIVSLRAHSSYAFRIVACDAAGNTRPSAAVTAHTR